MYCGYCGCHFHKVNLPNEVKKAKPHDHQKPFTLLSV